MNRDSGRGGGPGNPREQLVLSLLVAMAFGVLGNLARANEGSSGVERPDFGADALSNGVRLELLGRKELDLDGVIHRLGERRESLGMAIVFLEPECPVANQLIPELNRLASFCQEAKIEFYGVVSSDFVERDELLRHREEYGVEFPVLLDVSGELARILEPTHTPEAFVIDRSGGMVYRGRVHDGFFEVSKRKPRITRHDLRLALDALKLGVDPEVGRTPAVGCLFERVAGEQGTGSEVPTYCRDVAPILYANCVECHREGEVAPFSLATFSDARRRARMIASVVEGRVMPPWSPSPGFGHFLDARRLGEKEIETLGRWAEAGAPEGDGKDLPPVPSFPDGWRLGEPDLVLEPAEPFEVPADGPDVFRCFVLPTELVEDRGVIGVEFEPGAPAVVHHAIFYLDDKGIARRLDKRDEGPGYSRFGGPGFPPSGSLGGWAPGAQPITYPDGMGRKLDVGEDVVLQVHYHPNGKKQTDRSRIALYFSEKKLRQVVRGTFMGRGDVDIPPGEENYELRSTVVLPASLELIRITPHMHLLGREMKVTAILPDGRKEPLIWIEDWDFNWQGQYRYASSLALPKGTRIDLYARYDNSADNPFNPNQPPRRVRYGEQTTDEMCFCFLLFVTEDRASREAIRRATWRSFILPSED